MTVRRYLVTGGLGFLGSGLVRALVRSGHRVRILDNCSRGSLKRLEDLERDVEVLRGDIRDVRTVSQALQDIDSVCHMAYVNGTETFYTDPVHVLEVGIKGMSHIVDECVRQGVKELILASSSEVYQTPPIVPTEENAPLSIPDPFNPRYSYAGGKIISELMAIHYGKKYFERVLIFRPHNVYGPDMGREHVIPQFIERLIELKKTLPTNKIQFPIQGTGEQSRAFVYIEDFISGLMLILEKGKHLHIYNVGTTEEVSIQDLANRIAAHLGIVIELIPGTPAEGSTMRRCPNIHKLQALGYSPRFRLEDGLPPTIQWYAKHLTSESNQKPFNRLRRTT
jgi:nucleoside-diphosphate-sugar epimerase